MVKAIWGNSIYEVDKKWDDLKNTKKLVYLGKFCIHGKWCLEYTEGE